jgi:hypothetical protein
VVQRVILNWESPDLAAFKQTWQEMLRCHPFLRSFILWEVAERPILCIRRGVQMPIEYQDWRALPRSEDEGRLLAYAEADRGRGFNPATDPSMRLLIAQTGETTYHIVMTNHYMRLDGWSFNVLIKEFLALYESYTSGQGTLPPPQQQRYTNYLVWLQQQDLSQAAAFWRQTLNGFSRPTPLVARTSAKLPPTQGDFTRQHVYLPRQQTQALQTFVRQQQLTINTVVQAMWALLLHAYTSEEDVIFGVMVAGRPATLAGVELMVGPFANILPLRVRIAPNRSLSSWLKELRAQQVELTQYEHTPLRSISEWLGHIQYTPLFESYLAFQNLPSFVSNSNENSHRLAELYLAQMEYPVRLDVFPGAELAVVLSYYPSHFHHATITRMLKDFRNALERIVENPEQKIARLVQVFGHDEVDDQ